MSKKFRKLAFEGVIFQGMLTLLSFAWVSILAHYLDTSEVGKVMVAVSAANTIVILGGFGIQHALAVKAGSYNDQLIVSNGIIVILISGLVAALVGYITGDIFSTPERLGVPIFVCAATTFFLAIHIYIVSLARAIHRFRIANVLSIVQPLLFNFQMMVGVLGGVTLMAQDVLIEFVLSVMVAGVTSILTILRLDYFIANKIKKEVVGEIIAFGWRTQFGNVIKEVMYKADLYIVSILLGSFAAGSYGVVLKVIEGLGRFVDALGMIILPLIAKSEQSNRNRLTQGVISAIIPISLVIALGLSILSEPVVNILFGGEFAESAPLLAIGVFALIPLAIWKVLANDFIGRGALRYYIVSVAMGACSIVTLNYFFIEEIGLSLAPWVLVFSYMLSAFILLIGAKYRYRMSLVSLLVVGYTRRSKKR